MTTPERIISVMSLKPAQRRSAADIAEQLGYSMLEIEAELDILKQLGYVKCWGDGTWGLTSLGNMRRNLLSADCPVDAI